MEQGIRYTVLGCMSGTSLDGLDLALCRFHCNASLPSLWSYELLATHHLGYDKALRIQLQSAHDLPGKALTLLDRQYGEFIGHAISEFLGRLSGRWECELVASHGHTVFHDPAAKCTLQIGHPAAIAAECKVSVLADFRSMDVALGGQGAPLVPIGDHLLFSEYAACVNLGGFANVSLERSGQRIAWDICPVNFVLNDAAVQAGSDCLYDDKGALAAKGTVIEPLLARFEALSYYRQPAPKSLAREWVEREVFPLLNDRYSAIDVLRTWVEHVARRVANDLNEAQGKVLFSGGGIHNDFLMERISALSHVEVIKADPLLADYKEALVFAFLGALWLNNENNVLGSVTGARSDHRSGVYCAASQK